MSSDATGVCAKQVAYLAGPMRGYAEYNFPAFHAAAAKLRGHGLDVWSPAEHDVNEDGFDPAKDTHQPMKHYMRRDLPAVLDADMVCVLPGWEKSQGACLEVLVAQTCGIPVYVAETMQPVPSKPSETATSKPERVDTAELVYRLQTYTNSFASDVEGLSLLPEAWNRLRTDVEEACRLLSTPSATVTRDSVIEDVAKAIEAAPLTYMGPDPGAVRDLHKLVVLSIRDLKGKS